MKKHRLLFTTATCLLLIAGAVLWYVTYSRASGDKITLPDGSVVRLVAVTSGTSHTVGPWLVKFSRRLPVRLRMLVWRAFGSRATVTTSISTKTPQVVLWFDTDPNGPPLRSSSQLKCIPTDANGFSADENGFPVILNGPFKVYPAMIESFPRREPIIRLDIIHKNAFGVATPCGQLQIKNPFYKDYPKWKPESLPATKHVDNLEVTLSSFVVNEAPDTDASQETNGGQLKVTPSKTNLNPEVFAYLKLRTGEGHEVSCSIAGVGLEDATGNQIKCRELMWGSLSKDWCGFSPGLWTNESAWRIKFGFKRASQFQPAELVKFENVPLGNLDQSNRLELTASAQGVTMKLNSLLRRAPAIENLLSRSNLSQVDFEIYGLRSGQSLDLVEAITDDGTKLSVANPPGSGTLDGPSRTYFFGTIPRHAQTASFTFAIPTNLTVEFLVRPGVVTEPMQFKVEQE